MSIRWSVGAAVVALLLAGCISEPEGDDPGINYEGEEDPAPERVSVEWGDVDSAALRPGGPIGWCTFNFLFVDPDGEDRSGVPTYYVGTAAHCVDDVDERIPLAGHGEIGEVAFTTWNDTFVDDHGVRRGADFALVRLDPGMNLDAHPRMMNTDGPTGVASGSDVALGDELEHHGYGMVFGSVEPLRDRPGFLLDFSDDYCSHSVVWWGDSGSPVLHADSGLALGLVSRLGAIECQGHLTGATIYHVMDELAKTPFSNVRLALVDGSYTDRWSDPAEPEPDPDGTGILMAGAGIPRL